MNKHSIIIIVFLLGFFLQLFVEKAEAKHLAAPACSGYYGKFTATNWPGGKVKVTCEGAGRKRGKCVGESTTLSPGQAFDFSHCNCLDKSMSCIAVTGLPKGCTLKTKLACAANRKSIKDDFTIQCDKKTPVPGKPTAKPKPTVKPGPTATVAATVVPTVPAATATATLVPTVTPTPTPTLTPTLTLTPAPEAQTYQTPPWYCLALGQKVGDWVGCQK